MKSEELNEQVASKLDRMMLKINSVRERLDHQRQSTMPHMGTPSLDNLRSCVQNAYDLASCASKSARDGRITQWMSSINPNGDDQSVSVSHISFTHCRSYPPTQLDQRTKGGPQ
jgi:hypothetical protein